MSEMVCEWDGGCVKVCVCVCVYVIWLPIREVTLDSRDKVYHMRYIL